MSASRGQRDEGRGSGRGGRELGALQKGLATLLLVMLATCVVYLGYLAVAIARAGDVAADRKAVAVVALGLAIAAGLLMVGISFEVKFGQVWRGRVSRPRHTVLVAWLLALAAVIVATVAGGGFAGTLAFVLMPATLAFYLLTRQPIVRPARDATATGATAGRQRTRAPQRRGGRRTKRRR